MAAEELTERLEDLEFRLEVLIDITKTLTKVLLTMPMTQPCYLELKKIQQRLNK